MRKHLLHLLIGLLLALTLAACGGGEEPTPTPTKTPIPQESAQEPTPTATTAPATDSNAQAAAPTAPPAAPTEPPATLAPVVEKIARIAASQLNIRAQPDLNANIVKLALEGEEYGVVETSADGQWTQVSENGAPLGWAAAEYLTIEERVVQGGDTGGDNGQTAEPAASQPTAAPAAAVAFAPATMNSPDFGGQAFLWWRPELADHDLGLMSDGGFNWVKQTFAWETIEGAGRGVFDWTVADRVVQQANKRGLKLLARLSIDPDKTSFWAGTPPGNAAAFAEYAGALAARYNCQPGAVGCIQAFQVWNEPNLAREWGNKRPNPCLLYTSPSPRDRTRSRMPSSA